MRRLFEDPHTPSDVRDELLRSRAAGQDYDASAKLLQLRAALADPAREPLGEASKFSDTVQNFAWRFGHPGWKVAALLAVGGGLALLARPDAPAPQLTAAPIAEPAPVVVAPVEPPPAPVAEEPAAPVPEVEAAVRPAPAPQQNSRREIAQLVRIRALLDRDPAAAYKLAQRSEREFPRGLLSEERLELSIIALAKSGDRGGAEKKAREFFARFPRSPMRDLVEAALKK